MTIDSVGIHISRSHVHAYRLSHWAERRFSHDAVGFADLQAWLSDMTGIMVTFEAREANHRKLERYLDLAGIAYVKLAPRQARYLAERSGRLVKGVTMDARVLAAIGAELDSVAQTVAGAAAHELRRLVVARRALMTDLMTARKRHAVTTHPLVQKQLAQRILQIADDIASIDAAMSPVRAVPGLADCGLRNVLRQA